MTHFTHRLGRAALVVALLAIAACDGADGSVDANVTYEGRVTDDASTARRSAASVEGAVVTAASVSAEGQTRALGGSATTTADGRFSLQSSGTADAVRLAAEAGSFTSAALVEAGGATSGTIRVPPMTVETAAEADVYVAAEGRSPHVCVADAVWFVTAEVAADVEAGRTTAVAVAAALDAALAAERRAAEEDGGSDDGASDDELEEVEDERDDAYRTLRLALSASASASASAAAFDEGYVAAYSRAGISARTAARAARARALATQRFAATTSTQAATSIRARAHLLAATATALAVEAEFEARGAATSRMDALRAARAELVASLRTAATEARREAAKARYRAAVEAELAAETGLSSSQLALATLSTASAQATLMTAVGAASSGEAVADALVTYYSSARTALDNVVSAEVAAEVVLLLSAF